MYFQFTNRDSDRFRQLLRWIKSKQASRPPADGLSGGVGGVPQLLDEGTGVSLIRREAFGNVLEVLGVFATRAQADALFDKYDAAGRGYLTLHELMCRASSALENDHAHSDAAGGSTANTSTVGYASELASGRNDGPRSDEMFAARGKKQFLRQKLTGEGERPITPQQDASLVTVPLIVRALREKLRILAPSGETMSVPRARRHLARVFEYYDPQQIGTITLEQLVRALHQVNFPLGAQHQRLLLDAFPSVTPPLALKPTRHGANGAGQAVSARGSSIYAVQTDALNRPMLDPTARGFDYVSFILYVFPDNPAAGMAVRPDATSSSAAVQNPYATSLYLNHELGREFFDKMSVEERRKRGLPPTHEQYEAMHAAQMAAAQQQEYGAGQEEKEGHMNLAQFTQTQPPAPQQHSQQATQRPAPSQFARERAPPTPMPPLSPSEHYRKIAGRAPAPEWQATVAKNPYLQTVLAVGAKQPGFPFAPVGPGSTGSGTSQTMTIHSPPSSHGHRPQYAPVIASPAGSISARTHRDAYGATSLPPASPRGAYHRGGMHGQGGEESAYAPMSNALNPFATSTSFIPQAAFLHPPRTPAVVGMDAPGATFGSPSANLPRSMHTPAGAAYSYSSNGADAFSNILAAPAPTRRPQTGVTTYVRGGAQRTLPPMTPLSPMR